MNNLYIKLQEVRRRPELYLNEKSLDKLSAFILGYMLCEEDCLKKRNKLFDGFEKYIELKYAAKGENVFQTIGSRTVPQTRAFDKFFELLEDFLSLHSENLE